MPGDKTRDVLMGIDGGTGSIRVGLYDFNGNRLAFDRQEYHTEFVHPGWAEQEPMDWWKSLQKAVSGALEKGGISADRIAALSCDTTCIELSRQESVSRL